MTQSLPQAAHEHHERILAHVDRMPEMADALLTAHADDAKSEIASLFAFFEGTLLPHIDAAERSVYPELERMFQNVHSMAPLRREHAEVRRATAELAKIRTHLGEQHISVGEAIALRRVIFHLYALLKVHLAEEQVYLDILDRREAPEMSEALAAAMAHPGSPEA